MKPRPNSDTLPDPQMAIFGIRTECSGYSDDGLSQRSIHRSIHRSIRRSIHRSTKDKLHTLFKQRTLFQLEVACFPFRVRRKRSEGSAFHPEQMNSATKCNVVAKDTPSFVVNRTRPEHLTSPIECRCATRSESAVEAGRDSWSACLLVRTSDQLV